MSRTYSAGVVTAYGSALAGGYTGTYEEFCNALGELANVLTEFENFSVTVSTLPAGSSATASYNDGVLALGIPKGDKGDKGNKGDTGATGNGIVNIVKTGTAGLVDTYTVNYTNGGTATFSVTNGEKGDTGATGNGIVSITKTGTSGNVDTYTVLYSNGNTDTITVTNGSVTSVNGLTGDVVLSADDIAYDTDNSVKDELDNKANVDGYYEDLTSGNAEQIVSSIKVTDLSPYNFRTSGGALDIGNRETVKKIVGASFGWNQLFKELSATYWSPHISTTFTWGTNEVTIEGVTDTWQGVTTKTNIDIISGHKYLITCDVKIVGEVSTGIRLGSNLGGGIFFIGDITTSTSYVTMATIVSASSSVTNTVNIANRSGTDDYAIRNLQLFDLTLDFSPTIADYIYSLEQANTGDGVAWFKKYFPKRYYANGQSLESVYTSAHKMVGFNQLDESTLEVGSINTSTGENNNTNTSIRNSGYIRVLPNTVYEIKDSRIEGAFLADIFYYDGNQNFISYDEVGGTYIKAGVTFTTPSNCVYMRFRHYGGGTTLSSVPSGETVVHLHWDGERDGEYEPYDEHVYNLDPVILRGEMKLDSDNNMYFEGDEYLPDGTVNRNWAEVDLGDLNWDYNSGQSAFVSSGISSTVGDGLKLRCAKYVTISSLQGSALSSADKVIGCNKSSTTTTGNFASGALVVKDSAYSDATTFKTAMRGVKLAYALATPTTESAESFPSIQIVDNWGTEQYVDYAVSQSTRDVEIPVGSETDYPISLKDKLETLADVPDGDGLYLLKQESGENTYVQYVSPVPTSPSEDGTYVLKCTVSSGTATLSWVAEE